jgi:hypothetical protein
MNLPADDPAALLALSRILLGLDFKEAPVLVAGRVPERFPSDLVPPPPVVTVGGVSVADKVTAVFRYPPGVDSPIVAYRALLERAGWTPAHTLGDGFDNTVLMMLCRESVLATLHGATGDSADTAVLVSLSECDDWPCRERPPFPDHGTIKIPRLVSPPGVDWHSGGQCGAGDHTTHNIRISTTLTPHELLPLYANQLADAGWHIGDVQTTPTSALQWVEATDQRGRTWRGMLAIYENGPGRDVFIYLGTPELRPTRQSSRPIA